MNNDRYHAAIKHEKKDVVEKTSSNAIEHCNYH